MLAKIHFILAEEKRLHGNIVNVQIGCAHIQRLIVAVKEEMFVKNCAFFRMADFGNECC